MTAKPRRRFRVVIDGGDPQEFPSERRAYDHVHASIVTDQARVWIDEGTGRGWQSYEDLTAEELAR